MPHMEGTNSSNRLVHGSHGLPLSAVCRFQAVYEHAQTARNDSSMILGCLPNLLGSAQGPAKHTAGQ